MTDIIKRAREILDCEAEAIRRIPLDASFAKAVDIIVSCTGKVVTTGMGKAGTIARKVAGTLSSTATPSCYLHPGESEHGDLGLLSAGDVVCAFSTSGKTREVIEMLRLARRLGVHQFIGITSHPDSMIRELCSVVLDMGDIVEPCKLGVTPTASTTVMIALGDALALTVMEMKGITLSDYGLRHHGGYLGLRANGCDVGKTGTA